jgi:flavin-dependent dehydrogenase
VGANTDLLTVGAGPAGLASAIAARQFGLNIMAVGGRQPLIVQPCGEGLMPDGVAAIDRYGIQPLNEATPFQGIRFPSCRDCKKHRHRGAGASQKLRHEASAG